MALTPIPTLATPEPTPPARGQMAPALYIATFDAWLAARPQIRTEMNAAIGAMNTLGGEMEALAQLAETGGSAAVAALEIAGYVATSASAVSLTAGAKVFELQQDGRQFANGDQVWCTRRGDRAARALGVVSAAAMAADPPTMTVTFAADDIFGSGGPYTDWIIEHAALAVMRQANAAQIRADTPGFYVSADAVQAALEEVVLADAATLTPDLDTFINGVWTLGGNRILGNPAPAGMIPGRQRRIRVINGASYTLSIGSQWHREGGVPFMPVGAGAVAFIDFEVVTPTYIRYAFSAPS